MKTRLVPFVLLAAVLAISLPMLAHHGNAAYDMKEVTINSAKVTNFFWSNPHCIVLFDAKDASGTMQHWNAELGSPSAIGLTGWTQTSIKPGDMITVYIHLSKTGNPVGRITRIKLPDGSMLPKVTGGGYGGRGGAEADDKY